MFGSSLSRTTTEDNEIRQFTPTDIKRAFEEVPDLTDEIILPIDELVEICDGYLATLYTTLWSDWTISDPKRRIIAARWLAEQIQNVGKFVAAHDGDE